jgi:hypothetical protein
MADPKESQVPGDTTSTPDSTPRRGGTGDDTSRESTDRGGERHARSGPSSQSVPEGLEGAVLEENERDQSQSGQGSGRQQGRTSGSAKPTGAGAEAAEGMHAFAAQQEGEGKGDDRRSRSTPANDSGNASGSPSDVERAGSEPLRGTSEQHVSGYGGGGRGPRNSSDTREPLDYDGSGGDTKADSRDKEHDQHDRPH